MDENQQPSEMPKDSSDPALKSYLKVYFTSVRSIEVVPILSASSLFLSALFVSKIFSFFILNLLYVLNISFFALISRDAWSIRRTNPVALVANGLSIFLSAMLLIDLLKMLDTLASIGNIFD